MGVSKRNVPSDTSDDNENRPHCHIFHLTLKKWALHPLCYAQILPYKPFLCKFYPNTCIFEKTAQIDDFRPRFDIKALKASISMLFSDLQKYMIPWSPVTPGNPLRAFRKYIRLLLCLTLLSLIRMPHCPRPSDFHPQQKRLTASSSVP